MEVIVYSLLILCLVSFVFFITNLEKLLSTGEVNNFTIITAQNLSDKAQQFKKRVLAGGFVFAGAILLMLIITSIFGPIKG